MFRLDQRQLGVSVAGTEGEHILNFSVNEDKTDFQAKIQGLGLRPLQSRECVNTGRSGEGLFIGIIGSGIHTFRR